MEWFDESTKGCYIDMEWQTPKTNWTANDRFNISDYNRIKNNLTIIDHHKTYDDEKYTKYHFVNVKIKLIEKFKIKLIEFYQFF